LGDGFFQLSCDTKSRGFKSLEAFPRDDVVRVRPDSLDDDQKWEFVSWFY
jgi:hypothetical protein